MTFDLIIAGFGGQGVLFAGQLLAHAALDAGLETTWYPSYGPEMRGGTANCTVVISDEPIGSPVTERPQAAIVMNLPSLDRYEPLVRPGGVLVVNASLIDRAVTRDDVDVITIPADDVAAELGHPKLTNMVLLGAAPAHAGDQPGGADPRRRAGRGAAAAGGGGVRVGLSDGGHRPGVGRRGGGPPRQRATFMEVQTATLAGLRGGRLEERVPRLRGGSWPMTPEPSQEATVVSSAGFG
jgi:2-oxoglutarate ferredoxin oxidoreductase subunit gamma